MRPDDPALLIADGDALSRAQRPADAIVHYRRAAALVQDKTEIDMKINAAEAQLSSSQADVSQADVAMASDATRQQRQPAGPAQGNTGAALQIARTSREATLRYSNAERESSSH
jgi:hypothetical protein